MRLALVDHYDSFSFNVLDWLVGPPEDRVEVVYVPFDDPATLAAVERDRLPLVLSPGPKSPADAPQTLALISRTLGQVPILGICLGHQLLALAAGALIVRARAPFHGSRIGLRVVAEDILAGMPEMFEVATYNSLTVVEDALPASWKVLARSIDHGEIQAMARIAPDAAPAFGLQFHPESFMSENSDIIRKNWLAALQRGPLPLGGS
jgi:anthranilate synthase/aminodeoxychorismate synthase-like glutamine amidotransferase